MTWQGKSTDRHLFYYTSDILQKYIRFRLEFHKAAIKAPVELKVLSTAPDHQRQKHSHFHGLRGKGKERWGPQVKPFNDTQSKQKMASYRRIEMVVFLFLSRSLILSVLLFLLWVWWKAEVLFHTVVVVVYAVRDQNNGPSGEGWHIVTTGDLNCRFQSVTVTIQQGNTAPLLAGSTGHGEITFGSYLDSKSWPLAGFNYKTSFETLPSFAGNVDTQMARWEWPWSCPSKLRPSSPVWTADSWGSSSGYPLGCLYWKAEFALIVWLKKRGKNDRQRKNGLDSSDVQHCGLEERFANTIEIAWCCRFLRKRCNDTSLFSEIS